MHSPSNEFQLDFPTSRATARIYDAQDLQRAVEAYRFFYPLVSGEGIINGARELGIEDGKALMVLAAGPRHVVFTANSDTPYASGTLDLGTMGPVVVDMPAGPFIALANDHYQRWIVDMGIPGPDEGNGGKYLILPPGYAGDVPAGYHVARSRTNKVLVAIRALPTPPAGGPAGALRALQNVRVYSLATPSAVLPYIDVSERSFDATPLRWEDNIEYWRRLHGVLDAEPPIDELRPLYGILAALGIERGRPFAPDARMIRILEKAAKIALDQMRVEGFASGRPDRIVWNDRQWEWIGLVPDNANFETKEYLDLQARDRWFVQAIVTSPAMFRRRVGAGSVYFLAARDQSREYLDGSKSYTINIPQPVPAELFWSVTAYDTRTRSQVKTPQDRAVLGSLLDTFEPNADGSIDIHLGPTPPRGKEKQWIQTIPGEGFFLYFRIYGPVEAAFDGSWRISDVLPAEVPTPHTVESISTPDEVQSPVGTLRFERGMPTAETANALWDNLDYLHGVQSFLNSFQAASMCAMRRGFLDVGVRDNDVLLFSGLMDAKSIFLTGNCDTPYCLSFIDLSNGPMVLEAPPGMLGVIDDMWSRWVTDIGLSGPDRGEGGRYLLVPPGYAGQLPDGGHYVAHSRTNRVLLLGRMFLEDNSPAPAATQIREQLRIRPYVPGVDGASVASFLQGKGEWTRARPDSPQRIVEGTGLAMNTIPPNDLSFYELLHEAVQLEPAESLDPELAGQFAAIGIVKGKPFQPDARMRKLLTDSVAVASSTARALALRPRESEGYAYYDSSSAWVNTMFVGGYDFLRPPPIINDDGVEQFPNPNARTLNSRSCFFYVAFGITPAMCMRMTGVGSQYVGAFADERGNPLDGAKTYKLTLPPNIPAAMFWSLTLYDDQTRSMLDTPQRFPRAGSQSYPSPAAVAGADGSTTIYFGPNRPDGVEEGNWIQTLPGQGWFVLLRLYGPLAPFFDKSWRPSEIEEVKAT